MSQEPIKVGLSVGDLHGIGLEVILKSLVELKNRSDFQAFIFASSNLIDSSPRFIGQSHLTLGSIDELSQAESDQNYVVEVWKEALTLNYGNPTPLSGAYALRSLEAATEALLNKEIDVLVTAPIDKNNIQSKTFTYPGHTEYLAHKAGVDKVLMFLVSDELRVGIATGHVPVDQIRATLTEDVILSKLKMMHHSLKADFGLVEPKIAVLGLNPHAGDNGLIGTDEIDLIIPCLVKAREHGINALGPFPADGFFGSRGYQEFDAVLAMYHDQGLIPFKTIAFENGVNFTAGLPFVRSSPDHGTAFGIAGQGVASAVSFIEAIETGIEVFKSRTKSKAI